MIGHHNKLVTKTMAYQNAFPRESHENAMINPANRSVPHMNYDPMPCSSGVGLHDDVSRNLFGVGNLGHPVQGSFGLGIHDGGMQGHFGFNMPKSVPGDQRFVWNYREEVPGASTSAVVGMHDTMFPTVCKETPSQPKLETKMPKKRTHSHTKVKEKKVPKKRSRNTDMWKRNKRKELKNKGLEYTTPTGKTIPAKAIMQGCPSTCRYKCHETFPPEEREAIFKEYWSLENITAQRQFIIDRVEKIAPIRPNRRGVKNSRRTQTLIYTLIKDDTSYKICKGFFLGTLGIKQDIVFGAFRKLDSSGAVLPDNRGKHANHKTIDAATKKLVRDHIKSFPTHLCGGQKYLDTSLNIKKMYDQYTELCQELGVSPARLSMYRSIFSSDFKLKFYTPQKEKGEESLEFGHVQMTTDDGKIRYQQHNMNSALPGTSFDNPVANSSNIQNINANAVPCSSGVAGLDNPARNLFGVGMENRAPQNVCVTGTHNFTAQGPFATGTLRDVARDNFFAWDHDDAGPDSSDVGMSDSAFPSVSTEKNNATETSGKKGSKKRTRNLEQWKRNIRKELKNKGLEYTTQHGKVMPAKAMKEGCGPTCRYKCHESFPPSEREAMFKEFWSLENITAQRQFIIDRVEKIAPLRPDRRGTARSRRSMTLIYKLGKNEKTYNKVCKAFFLGTFGINQDVVFGAFRKLDPSGAVAPDKRGKHTNHRTIDEDTKNVIRNHIKSFPTYCCGNQYYLDSALNITKMYSLYTERCAQLGVSPATLSMYRYTFNAEFNLLSQVPQKEKCEECSSFEHLKTPTEEEKIQHQQHIRNVELVRQFKNDGKERAVRHPDVAAACFDLQPVLQCPHGEESAYHYKRKLAVYNLSVHDLSTGGVQCYMWPEHHSSIGANQISTCIFNFIMEQTMRGKRKIYLMSENCPGKVGNHYVATVMWHALQIFPQLDRIEHCFLEDGHTQHENETIQSSIRTAAKGLNIFVPEHWYDIVRSAGKKKVSYIVKEMSSTDFFDFKDLAMKVRNLEMDDSGGEVRWRDIKSMVVIRADPNSLIFRYDRGGKPVRVDMLGRHQNRDTSSVLTMVLNPLIEHTGVSEVKKTDLISLCVAKQIPDIYHEYYNNIPVTATLSCLQAQ